MNATTTLKNQWKRLLALDRPVKLFLTVTVLYGMYFAVKGLFFNFYILSLGFDKEFLGLANSMAASATLVLALPLGILTDRIGRKKAVLIGQFTQAVGYLLLLASSNGTLMLAAIFLAGIGETLFYIANTPLLTRLTNQDNRNYVFSLYMALFTLSGVLGNLVGGQMPLWLRDIFAIQPNTTSSYQGILLAGIAMILLTLIPILLIPRSTDETSTVVEVRPEGFIEQTNIVKIVNYLKNILHYKIIWQLFFPNLLIGMGAALMVPYLNLFFVETFGVSEQTLGILFSVSALVTGTGTLLSPWLARHLGTRIRALVFAQCSSLLFLALLGASPWLGIAVIGYLGRNALMNMTQPLFSAFSMEQVAENEQGTLNSLLTLSWQTGWALMPTVSGFIQAHFGFTPIFIITGLLYFTGTALIWIFFNGKEVPDQKKTVIETVSP